jgi:hypothetical protein
MRRPCIRILNAVNYQYCEIWSYNDSDCKCYGLLGCDIVQICWLVQKLREQPNYFNFRNRNVYILDTSFEYFAATEFNKMFSGRQQHQCAIVFHRFRDGVSSWKVGQHSHIDKAVCPRTFFVVLLLLKRESAGPSEKPTSIYKTTRHHTSDYH